MKGSDCKFCLGFTVLFFHLQDITVSCIFIVACGWNHSIHWGDRTHNKTICVSDAEDPLVTIFLQSTKIIVTICRTCKFYELFFRKVAYLKKTGMTGSL